MLSMTEKEVEVYEEEKSSRRFWLRLVVAFVIVAGIIGGVVGGVLSRDKDENEGGMLVDDLTDLESCLPG